MNKTEEKIFGIFVNLFGEKVSNIIFDFYVNLVHDIKMFGILFSLPFKFIHFFKESYSERSKKES